MASPQKQHVPQDSKAEKSVFKLPKQNPYKPGTLEHEMYEKLKNGLVPQDELICICGGVTKVTLFFRTLNVVANPLHPANRWSSIVERVVHGDRKFLRLIFDVPLSVKEYWELNGHPPAMGTHFVGAEVGVVPNPYSEGTDRHLIFEKAREFRPMENILRDAQDCLHKPRFLVQKTWYDLAHPCPERHRCTKIEEKALPDGRKVVRLVPVKALLRLRHKPSS